MSTGVTASAEAANTSASADADNVAAKPRSARVLGSPARRDENSDMDDALQVGRSEDCETAVEIHPRSRSVEDLSAGRCP
jgi:hypothetical protein